MKKAILVNSSFYPCIGGVENSLRSIASCLVDDGWSVDIVTSDNNIFPSKESLFGATVYRYKQKHIFSYIFTFIILIKKLLQNDYDLVISRHHTLTVILRLLGVKSINYIVPGVHFFQNKYNLNYFKPLTVLKFYFNVGMQYLSFKCAKIFVFSNSMGKQVNYFISKKSKINYLSPGADDNRFYPINGAEKVNLRHKYDLPHDKTIILGLGRFVKIKNFNTLILAMNFLPTDFCLVLVGDGEEKSNFEQLILENDLSDRVFIRASVPEPEIYYQLADFFCMPSTYEPFGQVLLEATFAKLPIVALDSRVCVNVDTATHEIYDGFEHLSFLISENTPECFAKQFLEISKSSDIFIDTQSFINKYNWMALTNKIINDIPLR